MVQRYRLYVRTGLHYVHAACIMDQKSDVPVYGLTCAGPFFLGSCASTYNTLRIQHAFVAHGRYVRMYFPDTCVAVRHGHMRYVRFILVLAGSWVHAAGRRTRSGCAGCAAEVRTCILMAVSISSIALSYARRCYVFQLGT
jgi:hypothetical protein